MIREETVRVLARHAGLDVEQALDPDTVSGSTANGERVQEAVADFIATLQRLNHELNGPQPEEKGVGLG